MHKKNDVYAYIIEQIDKLLKQGIDYYMDKDSATEKKLVAIQEYLNSFKDEEPPVLEVKEKKVDVKQPQLDVLTKDFMNKLAKIKIEVLNLDTQDNKIIPPIPKKKPKPVARTSVFSSFLEKLNLEDFKNISVDDPNNYEIDNSSNRNSKLHSLDLTPLAARPEDLVRVNPTPMSSEDADEEFWKSNFALDDDLEDFVSFLMNDKRN